MNKDAYDIAKMQQNDMKKLIEEAGETLAKERKANADARAALKESDKTMEEILKKMEELGIHLNPNELEEARVKADEDTERLLAAIDERYQVAEKKSISYDDLVKLAHSRGYMDTQIHDLLTEEEIRVADERFNKIEAEFKEKTKLTKTDIAFLATAVALQVIRQYVFTSFPERGTASDGSQIMKERYGTDGKLAGKYYYATEDTILTQGRVPFDVIAGSKKFGLGPEGKGLDGNSHRFRTLGHDPILGYVFGTANIITNTVTWWDYSSHHIRYQPNAAGVMVPYVSAKANTFKIFEAVIDRFNSKNGKRILAGALIKEHLHLKSDKTTDGLPIPVLQTISPDYTQDLAEIGLDAVTLGNVFRQATYAEFINFVIALVHSLLCTEAGELDSNLYKVRTRKIILYSNAIATTSNIIAVGIGAAAGMVTDNPVLVRKSLKYFDVGGLLVTIRHLFSDIRFMTKVKEEFVHSKLDPLLEEELRKLDEYLAE